MRLQEVIVREGLTVYLVTDLREPEDTAEAFVAVYRQRVDVEITIRNLKLVLDV